MQTHLNQKTNLGIKGTKGITETGIGKLVGMMSSKMVRLVKMERLSSLLLIFLT